MAPRKDDAAEFGILEESERFNKHWLGYLTRGPDRISPWHDIDPIVQAGEKSGHLVLRVVNEIPRGTREKLEVNLSLAHNPLKQDIKNGNLRRFTYGDIPFSYGCVPRTWEDKTKVDTMTGNKGDGDPIDVVILDATPVQLGTVCDVQILGALALVDEGETDWKFIGYRRQFIEDVMGGEAPAGDELAELVEPVRDWFRYYKTTDGKPENTFAFDGKFCPMDVVFQAFDSALRSYEDLLRGKVDKAVTKKMWLGEA